jgi:hypothetical protein
MLLVLRTRSFERLLEPSLFRKDFDADKHVQFRLDLYDASGPLMYDSTTVTKAALLSSILKRFHYLPRRRSDSLLLTSNTAIGHPLPIATNTPAPSTPLHNLSHLPQQLSKLPQTRLALRFPLLKLLRRRFLHRHLFQ